MSSVAKRQETPDHWDYIEAALTWARDQARYDLNHKQLVDRALGSFYVIKEAVRERQRP